MTLEHLSDAQVEAYAIGALDEVDVVSVEGHVSTCEQCAQRLAREAQLELALVEVGRAAAFCKGCKQLMRASRCGRCGAARHVSGYEVESVLVENAHGRVYVARSPSGDRVALKELVFVQVPDAEKVEAFHREAAILRRLDHPGIPRFIAAFTEGEGIGTRFYLAQEFIAGESLLARLATHQFSGDEVMDIARQVLEVLCYLQSLSPMVFHRDLKPANLIRRPDGSIAVVDFGAARALGSTASATLVGTFGYMPVEQLAGIVDATSDLYALGATLWHLLTRREPWRLLEETEAARPPPIGSAPWASARRGG
jgi:serine/threonine-protein kinase